METRRGFLTVGGAAVVRTGATQNPTPPEAVLRRARALVRSGKLGRIGFCRLGHDGLLPALWFVLDDIRDSCMVEVNSSAQGAALLGDRATLFVTPGGCRLFPGRG